MSFFYIWFKDIPRYQIQCNFLFCFVILNTDIIITGIKIIKKMIEKFSYI